MRIVALSDQHGFLPDIPCDLLIVAGDVPGQVRAVHGGTRSAEGRLISDVGQGTMPGMKLLDRITVEPDTCGGRPCIRGLRVRVTHILAMLAEDVSHDDILRDCPYLEPDDIKAALAYAARQADHAVLQQS